MNITRLHMTKKLLNYARLINNVQCIQRMVPKSGYYSTLTIDAFTSEIFERHRSSKIQRNDLAESSIQHCMYTSDTCNVSTMSSIDLEEIFSELLTKNKHKKIEELVTQCQNCKKYLTYNTIKKLFKHYSIYGMPMMVAVIQTYCLKVDPASYKRNGEFLHYLAKAECIRGNSDKGLSILKSSYKKYQTLRSFYRIIFRELIQDSVLNRSEASLVIFKKYVMEFSNEWSDHYPLVCFWHICWASTWFSDQMLGNELLEESEVLLGIVGEKATAFTIMALKDFNEDAVVRLLQTLIKYDMMTEYVAVLQVLFNYKCIIENERAVVEIKCFPSLDRTDQSLEAAASKKKNFALELDDKALVMNKKHDYYYQVQGQMRVSKMDKCYFICFISVTKPLTVIEVCQDNEFISNMIPKLSAFFKNCILPEIILRRVQKNAKCIDLNVRNRDIRGCSEIIRNCEALGVNLPSDQQGRYIKMLIDDKRQWPKAQTTKTTSKDFKLKF